MDSDSGILEARAAIMWEVGGASDGLMEVDETDAADLKNNQHIL